MMDEIVTEMRQVWPECTCVHGRARHSQSQGGVERLNRTVEVKLNNWMTTNNSKNWSVGCLFTRWQINTSHSRAINDTPYRLAFGQRCAQVAYVPYLHLFISHICIYGDVMFTCRPRVGISSLPLSPGLLASLKTEAALQVALGVPEGKSIEDSFIGNLVDAGH